MKSGANLRFQKWASNFGPILIQKMGHYFIHSATKLDKQNVFFHPFSELQHQFSQDTRQYAIDMSS